MKKRILLQARVAALFIAAAVLASCYAPIANQPGHLNLNLQFTEGSKSSTSQVILLVIDSGYQATLAQTLNLIGKAHYEHTQGSSLSSSDSDTLKTLGKQLATSGAVKFGGYPFYQLTTSSGSFETQIPGIPAGRSYLVKIFVFLPGVSFSADKIDKNFWSLVQSENRVFLPSETYASDTGWQSWTPNTADGQPVAVTSGQLATINTTIVVGVP